MRQPHRMSREVPSWDRSRHRCRMAWGSRGGGRGGGAGWHRLAYQAWPMLCELMGALIGNDERRWRAGLSDTVS